MKKIISLLLVLVIGLSLAACASEGPSALEEADLLLAEGDLAGALAVLNEADEYSRLNAKINGIRLSQIQQDAGFSLLSTWKDVDGYYTVTFREDFTGTWINRENQLSMDYALTDDGFIHVTYPNNMKLRMVQEDGMNKLVNESGSITFVSEADYEQFVPDVIEITMDNYLEYFELRDSIHLYTNEFNEIESFNIGVGLFLKEAYIDRLASLTDVGFEVEVEREMRTVTIDEATGAYTLGEVYEDYNWDWSDGKIKVLSATIEDRRNWVIDERSTTCQQVCGMVSDTWWTTVYGSDVRYYCVLENPVVTRIQGTIELYK